MNKFDDLINNIYDNVEEKPKPKTPKIPVKLPEGVDETEIENKIKELESLKPLLGEDPKYYERFIELLSELEQYFSMSELKELTGIKTEKDTKEYTVTLTTEEFGSMLAFAMDKIFKTDYPQLKNDPTILNIIATVGAILWNIIKRK